MDFHNLTLDQVRRELIRLEDSIIFALIERAQFAHNAKVYSETAFGLKDAHGRPTSFLDHTHFGIEAVHATVRRWTSPDEYPFFPRADLPPPLPELPPYEHGSASMLWPNTVDVNSRIKHAYLSHFVPQLTRSRGSAFKDNDDGEYGCAAVCDIECLQRLSRRIHFGKFVAEIKYRQSREAVRAAVQNNDRDAIMALITHQAVEDKLLRRLERKARTYGQDLNDDNDPTLPAPGPSTAASSSATTAPPTNEASTTAPPSNEAQQHDRQPAPGFLRVPVETVVELYREFVIPTTKDVEVEYLMIR
ncbi:hypothetical protein CXG81DRAFT_2425, partial [Caulochytrium protostelioides]